MECSAFFPETVQMVVDEALNAAYTYYRQRRGIHFKTGVSQDWCHITRRTVLFRPCYEASMATSSPRCGSKTKDKSRTLQFWLRVIRVFKKSGECFWLWMKYSNQHRPLMGWRQHHVFCPILLRPFSIVILFIIPRVSYLI